MRSESLPREFTTKAALLTGGAATVVRRSAERVGEALARDASVRASGPALADGLIGSSVVLANLARALAKPAWLELAREDLSAAVRGLSAQALQPGLFAGFAGIAWGSAYLEREFFPEAGFDFDEIDDALAAWLRSDGPRDYDLISGWIGLGVYALERWPHPRAQELMAGVVSRLRSGAEECADGTTWKTMPALMPPHQRARAPHGYYNLGLAHGVPGAVALLAQADRVGALDARDRQLLESAVRWLRRQRDPDAAGMCYRSWRTEPRSESGSRLGWCYGDLGVAASLVVAGVCFARPAWLEDGVALAKRAARLDAKVQAVRDHGLCHGSAGIAHVFHRLWRLSGDDELAVLARGWLRKTLAMRRDDVGIDGYATWRAIDAEAKPESEWEYGFVQDGGYLTGAGGVALALSAALVPNCPEWDRPLLLSIPKAG